MNLLALTDFRPLLKLYLIVDLCYSCIQNYVKELIVLSTEDLQMVERPPLAAIFPGSIFGYSSGLNSLQSGYQIVCAGDLNDFWKIKLKGCGALSRYKANGFHIAFSFTSFNRVFLRHVSALDKLTAKNTGSGFSNNWH